MTTPATPKRDAAPDHFHAPAYWSGDAVMPGIYAITPMLPGTIAFGMACGALGAQKNFSLAEVEIMMAIGETLAHLTWLVNSGKLRRTIDAKGIIGYDLPVVGSMVDSKKLQETN